MKKIILFAVACIALAACTKDEINVPTFQKGQTVTISALSDLNGGTRVTGTDDGTNINFKWETGDKVLVKVGEATAEFTLKTGAGTANATFEGTMPADGSTFEMQYPVEKPDLSSQEYVADNQLPKGKMLFSATDCTLGSDAKLKPQYAVLQLNLDGDSQIAGEYFKRINVLDYNTEDTLYKLTIPENMEIEIPDMGSPSPFYIVVNPGTYGFKLDFFLYDGTSEYDAGIKLRSSSHTFVAGECLNMATGTIGCFAAGTRITMADGSCKKVEDIVEGDIVRTFDHEAGCISSQKVCLTYKGDSKATPLELTFASGKTLSTVKTHDLLLKDNLKYVRINSGNVKSYLGKQFYNAETGNWDELVNYAMGKEPVEFYCIYSAYHLNCIAEGMLTAPDDVDFLLNVYELDSNLKADPARLADDIQKYGLRDLVKDYPEYAEYANIWEELQFKYTNIALGKGLVTKDQLFELRNYWDNK